MTVTEANSSNALWQASHDFLAAAERTPTAAALTVENVTYSYGDVLQAATNIASELAKHETHTTEPVVAIFAHRSLIAYAGILAALMRGCTYVALNPNFSSERNALILERSKAYAVIGRPEDKLSLAQAISLSSSEVLSFSFDHPALRDTAITTLTKKLLSSPYAYYIFTSGSTGVPKGVPIRHSNLNAYLDAVFQIEEFYSSDRMSQNPDLTFDLSIHDLFVCWRAGAHMIVPSYEDLETPAEYVKKHKLTVWVSVPTLGQKMLLQGALTPGALSGLRFSMFIGEAFPIDLAKKWALATGNRVDNWYGPTEATVSCTVYQLPKNPDEIEGKFNLVSVGKEFPRMSTFVVDEDLNDVGPGTLGELLISGPQVADQYLHDPQKTADAFVVRDNSGTIYYRTGDRVLKDESGNIYFSDRIDNQIKIRGYRVELGEIESKIREASDGLNAIVVPLPLGSATPTALAAAIEGFTGDPATLLQSSVKSLPNYMKPTRILPFELFPRNASGKIDRKGVGALLADELAQGSSKKKKVKQKTSGKNISKRKRRLNKRRRSKLVSIVIAINPAISGADIRKAENLMDGGLDSLGFVNFTTELEKQFGLKLDQTDVVDLSHMSLKQISRRIRTFGTKNPKKKAKPAKSTKLHKRLQRTLDFVDQFPNFAQSSAKPLAGFVGSSGFLRGISPKIIEEQAALHGLDVTAANIGIAALSVEGIAELSEFIRDTMLNQGKRMVWGVCELDPMHLSTIPPSGDIEIVKKYVSGDFLRDGNSGSNSDEGWRFADGGATFVGRAKPAAPPIEPDWMRSRNSEVRSTYLGNIEMDSDAIETWIRGARALAEVSDHILAVVHPLNDSTLQADRDLSTQNQWVSTLNEIKRNLPNLIIIEDQSFELNAGDFMDKNHVNWWQGNSRFSRQIVDLILKGLG